MKTPLILLFLLLPILALAQPLEPYRHNFFTTNPAPVVDVVAGSNTVVTPSLIGTSTRRFTVSATATPAQTNFSYSAITNAPWQWGTQNLTNWSQLNTNDLAYLANNQTFTGSNNFTGGLAVNGVPVDHLKIFNAADYWTPDGTDHSAGAIALFNAVSNAGGGTIYFTPATNTYRADSQIVFPNDGNAVQPTQPRYRLTGGAAEQSWYNFTSTSPCRIDLRYEGTNGGKFSSLGRGVVEIDHLTIMDGGASTNKTPLIFTSNTGLKIHDCTFIGSGSTNQDAIVLGGTNAALGSGFTNAFQGYGTVIRENHFTKLNRWVYGLTWANSIVIENNSDQDCTGQVAIESDGTMGGSQWNTGWLISGNIFELTGIRTYAIVMRQSKQATISGNGFYDPVAGFLSCVLLTNATYSTVLVGNWNGTIKSLIEGESASIDSTTILTGNNSPDSRSGGTFGSEAAYNFLVKGSYTPTSNYFGGLTVTPQFDATRAFSMAYDTTADVGVIRAALSGSTAKPISLNPLGGNIGIGTTNPQAVLDVNGAVRLNSILIQTNVSTANTRIILNGSLNGSVGSILEYRTNNVLKFQLDNLGQINTYGVLNANAGLTVNNASLSIASDRTMQWQTGTYLYGNASQGATTGVMRMVGPTVTALNFGGDTSSFPSLRRNGGNMELTDGAGSGTTNSFSVPGTLTATNGYVHQLYATNGYTVCTQSKQFYLVNAYTNPLFVLPDASTVTGKEFVFSTTNNGCFFIVTNATGTQPIANGQYLSYTNQDNGIKVVRFISDGAAWWLSSKGRVTLPSASWSCNTNITFPNVTNMVTLDTQEANNGVGIALDNSAWFTPGVGSRIWVTNAGMYLLTFSAMWSKVGGGAANGDVWLRQDGAMLPRTMTLQTIQNATTTNVMTVNFILPVTKTTYFDLVGASPDGTAQMQAMPAITTPFARPAAPSMIVTIQKTSD